MWICQKHRKKCLMLNSPKTIINILNLTISDLQEIFKKLKLEKYRAKQIFEWIYKKSIFDFDQMINLPAKLRTQLKENFTISVPEITNMSESKEDNSYKFLLETNDKQQIESILMVTDKRTTVCVSCMIGCPLKCKFCATGMELKFARNLKTSEIIGQILAIKQFAQEKKISEETFNVTEKITNVVFMGMGEPLLNYENVDKTLEILIDENSFGLNKKRIALSTAGIIKNLSKLINKHGIKLAISLHFPTNKLRDEYMPINQKFKIEELLAELQKINIGKRDSITIEYIMMRNINDSLKHADQLIKILKPLISKVKINLIPYNPTKFLNVEASTEEQINVFAKFLVGKGIMTTVRRSKGKKVHGACGQFALKKSN